MHAAKLSRAADAFPVLAFTATYANGALDMTPGFAVYLSPGQDGPPSSTPQYQFAAELLGESGELVSRVPLRWATVCLTPGSDGTNGEVAPPVLINARLPLSEEVRALKVSDGGKVLAERWFPAEPPVVDFVHVEPAKNGWYAIAWDSYHPSGAEIFALAMVSGDDGHSWAAVSFATPVDTSRLDVHVGHLPGAETLTFGILVTDGLNTVMAQSPPIAPVPPKPEVLIVWPAAGSKVGTSVALVGVSNWPTDDKAGRVLVWSSSLDGHLGVGANLVVELTEGDHEIDVSLMEPVETILASSSVRVYATQFA